MKRQNMFQNDLDTAIQKLEGSVFAVNLSWDAHALGAEHITLSVCRQTPPSLSYVAHNLVLNRKLSQ